MPSEFGDFVQVSPDGSGGVAVADLLGDWSLQQPDSRAPARPADSAVERSGVTHRVGRVRPNQPAGGLHRPRSRGEGSVQLPAQDNRSAVQRDCDPLRGLHQQDASTVEREAHDVSARLLTEARRGVSQSVGNHLRMQRADIGPYSQPTERPPASTQPPCGGTRPVMSYASPSFS